MAKKSKKMQEALKKVDATKAYSVEEAVALAKETNIAKFDATVEVAYKLNVDPKKADQQIRGAVVLPNGTGKTQTVLVFAKGDKAKEAEAAGADFVGDDDMVQKIQGGWFDFDVVVATPDMMATVGKLGRVLGPKQDKPYRLLRPQALSGRSSPPRRHTGSFPDVPVPRWRPSGHIRTHRSDRPRPCPWYTFQCTPATGQSFRGH